MYKLTFRIWLALVSVFVFMAASYFAMKEFPTAMAGLHGAAILAALVVPPILVAFLAFAKGSPKDKIIVALVGIVFGLAYGAVANVTFGTTKLLPNFQLLINEYLLGIMALGGGLTALAFFSLKPEGAVESAVKRTGPTEVVIPDKEETSTKSSSTKLPAQSEPLSKSPSSVSSTNLKGILDNLAPDDDSSTDPPLTAAKSGLASSLPGAKSAAPAPTKQPAPARQPEPAVTPVQATPAAVQATPAAASPTSDATPAVTSPTDSQNNLPGQKKATTGTVASSTATRLQAQKRKSTSTFTKLQALSASGTGGIRQKPLETSGGDNDADSLKSILDRLDTKQEDAYSAPDEVEMDSLFGQESLLSPPEVSEPEPPKPAPVPVKTPDSPKPLATPEPVKPVVTPAPKPVTPPASSNVAAKPSTSKQYDSPLAKKPEAAPSLSSMLDALDVPKSQSTTSPAAKTSTPSTTGGAPAKPVTPSSTPKLEVTPSKPSPPVVAKTPTPTSTAKPVEVPKPAAKVEPVAKPEPKPEPKPVAKEPIKSEPIQEDSGLFETGLDKEIDDIFLNLVPAEAQKTVETKSELIEEEAVTTAEVTHEPAVEVEEPVKEGIFESTKIDQELDDIFSNLVPAEAQKEVAKAESKPAEKAKPVEAKKVEEKKPEPKQEAKPDPKPEPVREPEPVKNEGMFEESGLDRELDDIFSNLAPSEAQRSVTNETLARVRAADATGDHPAITPDNMMRERSKTQEEMSFAPPSEEAESSHIKEETTEQATEAEQSGKFAETLHAMPSLQATVEGLLNSLASSESTKTETESFAPPEAKEPANGSGVATKVMDLLESLEEANSGDSGYKYGIDEYTHESHAAQESAEAAAESSTGDIVSDLFDTPTKEAKEEPADELVAETAVEEATGEVTAVVADDTVAEEAVAEKEAETPEAAAEEAVAEKEAETPEAAAEEAVAEKEAETPEAVAEEAVAEKEAETPEAAAEEAVAEKEAETPEAVAEEAVAEKEAETPEAVAEEAVAEKEAETPEAVAEEAVAEKEAETLEATAGEVVAEKEAETPEAVAEEVVAEKEAETPEAVVEEVVAAEKEAETTEADATEAAADSRESRESEANRKTAKELKEFGRLSSKQGGTEFASETAGTMKTIGKLLIEVQAVENIIKAGESGTIGSGLTTARVISAARGEGIKALLSKIDSYSGVDGSVIVGHDGLVIASTAGPGMDKDTLGVLSVACLSTSNLATKKLEIGKLRQMVLVTDAKTTVLTDVDVGILAVFLDNNDVGKIDGLLEAIHDTIHG